jgi:hypothetical protein
MTRRSVYVRFAAPQVGKALFDQEDCIVDQISGLGFYDPAQLGGILALGKDDWQYLASQSCIYISEVNFDETQNRLRLGARAPYDPFRPEIRTKL